MKHRGYSFYETTLTIMHKPLHAQKHETNGNTEFFTPYLMNLRQSLKLAWLTEVIHF